MHWKPEFSSYLARLIIEEWEKNALLKEQGRQEEILAHIQQVIAEDLKKEKALEQEVQNMLDELEKTHAGQFERYKMYPMLKKKLAQKKGVVL